MRTITTYRKSGRLFILREMGFNTSDEGGYNAWTISPPGRRTSQMNRATSVTTSGRSSALRQQCCRWARRRSTSAAETPMVLAAEPRRHTRSIFPGPDTSSDLSGYNIYRAPYTKLLRILPKDQPHTNTSTLYTDSDVTSGASYCYATTAVNASNQESSRSNILTNVRIPST